MENFDATEIIEKFKEEKVTKLTDVGFTREQAIVLIDMISSSNFSIF